MIILRRYLGADATPGLTARRPQASSEPQNHSKSEYRLTSLTDGGVLPEVAMP